MTTFVNHLHAWVTKFKPSFMFFKLLVLTSNNVIWVNFSAILLDEKQRVVKAPTTGYVPVCYEIINLFIKLQNVLLMGLCLIVFFFDGLLMFLLYFVCKLLSNMRKQHIAAVSSESFCLWLLIWKYYLIHPLFIDVVVIFSRVPKPIQVLFKNKLVQLILMSVIFSTTKMLYNISDLDGPAVLQRPVHFPSTRPELFIEGHNTELNCIKRKWHHGRHLYYISGSVEVIPAFCSKLSQQCIKDFTIMV